VNKVIIFFLSMLFVFSSLSSFAEPTSEKVRIVNIRPYHNQDGGPADVYVVIDRVSVCNTNTYRIPMAWGGSKESVSAAMAALIAGRDVQLEVDGAGCGTPAWTTKIQSIYLW
jgi:hypothetical protein